MLDIEFLVPVIAGMLGRHFYSHKTSKKKIFLVTFFVFTSVLFTYFLLNHLERGIYLILGCSILTSLLNAICIVCIIKLVEIFNRKKKPTEKDKINHV